MSWVFENGPKDPSERLVLLALADYAADNGEWAPSMIGIAEKAGMTERGARGVIRRLEEGGWIAVKVGGGRGGKSQYRVLMGIKNPEQETRNDKPGMTNPESNEQKPGTKRTETRNQRSAVPSGTIKEPSEEPPCIPPAPQKPADKPEPKARLPADWALSDEGWAYARSKKIPDEDIRDEAIGFHAYWTDRGERKSARGWEQCWQNRVRAIAHRYANRGMAGKANPGSYGQGGSLAGIAARRAAERGQ